MDYLPLIASLTLIWRWTRNQRRLSAVCGAMPPESVQTTLTEVVYGESNASHMASGGEPVKLRNAVLMNDDDRSLGGIVLNGQHSFLERMPQQSWFKIRTAGKGQREVYLVFRCTGPLAIPYGPFANEERDRLLNDIEECLLNRSDQGPWHKDEKKLTQVLYINAD
jgi:hypothetical protein